MESPMQTNKKEINNNKNSKISKQTHIIEEIGENEEIQYKCTACRKTFRSRSQRYYHINCNQLQNLIYKCEHCDKSFARQTQWKYHTESHTSPVNECPKCQKIFSNPLALKKHVALHEVEPKSCPHCDKTFKKKTSLDQHVAAQHLNQLNYGCAYCCKKYASKSTLQLHLQTHEKKHFECRFCGKFFQRNSILNLHLKRHNKKNSYVCSVCQKNFSESGALARHRKIHEESTLQYYCKLCDKSILRKDNMTRHLITIHPEEKFDNIVEIIRPQMKPQMQTTMDSEECKEHYLRQKDITRTNKTIVVIENKLLYKPFEQIQSVTDVPKSFASKTDTVEYPLINQIKVITAVPTYERAIVTDKFENTSQEMITQCKNTNYEQQQDSSAVNYDFIKEKDKRVKQADNNAQDISFTDQLNVGTGLNNNQNYVYQQQALENYEASLTQAAFSSVIRSVGNVKKKLTSHINQPPTKVIPNTSPEYRHKKYSRNNYNIDLYRKILGCDDDDIDGDADVEKDEKFDNRTKSTTPVHWRKSFKNNYETSAS